MNNTEIQRALQDQKEEILSLKGRRWVMRDVLPRYKPLMASSAIKVIMGPRRSGKSTLALQLLEGRNFAYANFDDEALFGLRAADLRAVLEALHEIHGRFDHIFLDELQNVQGWELFANRLKRMGLNVIITGSNAKLLSRDLATHLTGRHAAMELMPFSFREFLAYRQAPLPGRAPSTEEAGLLRGHLSDYLSLGGFPEAYQEPERRRYLTDLYHSVLGQDIAFRQPVRFLRTVREMAHHLMAGIAGRMTYHKLKNVFSINSVHTVRNYLSLLEESYLVFTVERFSDKIRERATAPRKVYAWDAGMAQAVGRPGRGAVCENVVAVELKRRVSLEGSEFFYWQDAAGREVDFLVASGRRVRALIQVCADASDGAARLRETRALIEAARRWKCRDLKVVTLAEETVEEIDGHEIAFVPLWKWLLSTAPFFPLLLGEGRARENF